MSDTHPTTDSMIAQWQALAKEVSEAQYDSGAHGSLIVLGSGMAYPDFTRDADDELRSADEVFHCVYDKVTQARIGELRPDSYDLRILYGEHIDRHMTYVRMAEAMLHFVRQGKKVVAIFYGHPGVFAMPAHRAVHIARSEGHYAKMRPGVSALDYLVADIGFDPALPGLATFEATDLLLRKRRIDPSLHVVLWQVGVVGEFQFQPHGFENRGFEKLVDELVAVYGPDWHVTHYIAPQYVGIEPLIQQIRIGDLLDPHTLDSISSLSTFYIEPQMFAETDPDMAATLGFTRPGQAPPRPFRVYDYTAYGNREQAAVRGFVRFTPPPHYRLTPHSPEYEFMLDLSSSPSLQNEYRQDPAGVVTRTRFAIGSDRKARLLAIPHPRAIDAALTEDPIEEVPLRAASA